MPQSIHTDPLLITKQKALYQLVTQLEKESIIAVDTESNSLYAYQERVCLIQFSTIEQDYLVDPLALKDMSPLASIFSSSETEKVFHAAEYDLICLKRDFGYEFNNLFDTMVASRILGKNEVGLGSILKSEFGVVLNKKYQRANWGQRPLPAHLLDYARLDTHYLIELRDRIKRQLKNKGLWILAKEDFSRLCNINGNADNPDKSEVGVPDIWRVKGVYDLNPQQVAILYELCKYREMVAINLDRPLFKVVNDQTLINIAKAEPGTIQELRQIDGISDRQARKHGNAYLLAVQQGLKSQPILPPPTLKPDQEYIQRIERLRNWRKHTARKLDVQSDVILPREILYSLAARNPVDGDELAREMKDVPWRMKRFGNQILEVLLMDG